MSRTEFLQGLKSELEGRVPYSVIQENLRYYDSYIMEEAAKGQTEDEVIESLGGPRIIARTIVDAALDTEDRPDGFDSFESEASYRSGPAGSSQEEREPFRGQKSRRSIMWTLASGMSGSLPGWWYSWSYSW